MGDTNYVKWDGYRTEDNTWKPMAQLLDGWQCNKEEINDFLKQMEQMYQDVAILVSLQETKRTLMMTKYQQSNIQKELKMVGASLMGMFVL